MDIEFSKWLLVKTDSADKARAFFGMPADWPVEHDHEDVYRVLSDAWLKQQLQTAMDLAYTNCVAAEIALRFLLTSKEHLNDKANT